MYVGYVGCCCMLANVWCVGWAELHFAQHTPEAVQVNRWCWRARPYLPCDCSLHTHKDFLKLFTQAIRGASVVSLETLKLMTSLTLVCKNARVKGETGQCVYNCLLPFTWLCVQILILLQCFGASLVEVGTLSKTHIINIYKNIKHRNLNITDTLMYTVFN